mgnify:CR=1 FL=1
MILNIILWILAFLAYVKEIDRRKIGDGEEGKITRILKTTYKNLFEKGEGEWFEVIK